MDPLTVISLIIPLVHPVPLAGADPLVEMLASWDQDHRACAEHALRRMGDRAEGNLEWASRHHRDPAIRRASERLLSELDWTPSTPWIDFQEGTDRWWWMRAYLDAARDLGAIPGAPDWTDYRLAAAIFMRDMRRAGVPASRRTDMASFMEFREVEWWATHGRPAP